MAYERQQALRRELDARLPRGPRGGPQNELRFGVWFFGVQGIPFEVSLEKALALVRERHPSFAPRILPAPNPCVS